MVPKGRRMLHDVFHNFRCVPDNQRAFGLGIQLIFLRLFSFIPGPLILGSIIDANCLVWSVDECGNRGNCLEYEVDRLSMHFFIFALSATGECQYKLGQFGFWSSNKRFTRIYVRKKASQILSFMIKITFKFCPYTASKIHVKLLPLNDQLLKL